MKTPRYRNEADEWVPDGRKITAPENLEAIRRTLELEGPIIVEHWLFYGSRAPDRRFFDDFDEFIQYLISPRLLATRSTFGVLPLFAKTTTNSPQGNVPMKTAWSRSAALTDRKMEGLCVDSSLI